MQAVVPQQPELCEEIEQSCKYTVHPVSGEPFSITLPTAATVEDAKRELAKQTGEASGCEASTNEAAHAHPEV